MRRLSCPSLLFGLSCHCPPSRGRPAASDARTCQESAEHRDTEGGCSLPLLPRRSNPRMWGGALCSAMKCRDLFVMWGHLITWTSKLWGTCFPMSQSWFSSFSICLLGTCYVLGTVIHIGVKGVSKYRQSSCRLIGETELQWWRSNCSVKC